MSAGTLAKTAAPYLSGMCGYSGFHERCPGSVRDTICRCACHDAEPVEPAEPAVVAGPVEGPLLAPGTPEWLRLLTASKVAAVVGLSPYESRFSLYHRMAGLIEPEPDSDLLRRGHFLEPAIVAWFAHEHPDWTIRPSGTWIAGHDNRFAATPDRMVDTGTDVRCMEAKTAASGDEWGEPGTDQIPPGYRAQVMWEMDCTGTRTCHVAVLGSYLEFAEYVVEYDPDEAQFLREQAAAFLDSLPGGGNPQRPDIDAHDQTFQAIRQMHPDIDPVDVDLDADLARAYCTARYSLDTAKAEETRTKSLVADALGNGKRAMYLGRALASRQAKGDGVPYLVAGRNLPALEEDAASTTAPVAAQGGG